MDEEQASASLNEPTDLETEIYGEISKLLRKAWKRRVSLRLVSLKLSNLYDGRFWSMLALDARARQHEAQQRLADVVDDLREKYGRSVVLRGHDFILRTKSRVDVSSGASDMPDARSSSFALFPLTPALSLREREHRGPPLDQFKAPRLFDQREYEPPSPQGRELG